MKAFEVVFGLFLIAICMHDIFHTLFDPMGRGAMSEVVSLRIWRIARRIFGGRPALSLAGPVSFVVIVMAWLLTESTNLFAWLRWSHKVRFMTICSWSQTGS